MQDLALALTGSSTCTLIAFVFPAILFVMAAKEAAGKSDNPPPSQREVALAMAVGAVGSVFGTIATIAVLRHGGASHGR